MKKQIIIELEEEVAIGFQEVPKFWITDEKYNLIKPTIQETLKKFIIDSINERRIELAAAQAAMNAIKLKDTDIVVCGEK